MTNNKNKEEVDLHTVMKAGTTACYHIGMDLKEFIRWTVGSSQMNVKLLVTLLVMKMHITHGADYSTDYNCLSDALDLYERFNSIICQNTTSSKDPRHWLPTVCKEMCQITKNSTWCAAENTYIIRLNVTDGLRINFPGHVYSTINCLGCHNISEVNITCILNMLTCVKNTTIRSTSSQTIKRKMTDCSQKIDGKGTIKTSLGPNLNTTTTLTHGTTSNATCIQEGYLVLTALLGLVFGIVVILGLWLIKSKFVRSKLCVLKGPSVQNSTYSIPPRSSDTDTEIPKKPLTSDAYTAINKKKSTKTRHESNIYNHLHETRIDSDFNDSPYDHAQCLTEIQSTPVNVLKDNYTHIHKLC